MAVDELRRAFLFASEIEDRIRKFRLERLQILTDNEGPLDVNDSTPRIVLHIVPRAAFTDNIQLPFGRSVTGIRPLGASGWNSMHSLDGFVTYSGPEGQLGSVRAFTTLFRNGIVEAVARAPAGVRNERSELSLSSIEQEILPSLDHMLAELRRFSIPFPYYLMLTLVGIWRFCSSSSQ